MESMQAMTDKLNALSAKRLLVAATLTQRPLLFESAGAAKPQDTSPRKLFLALRKDNDWEENEVELRDIDKKNVVPPGKYKGDTEDWRHWFMKLSTFLARRDARWSQILEAVRKASKSPMDEEKELEVFKAIGVKSKGLRNKFKAHLYEYLETYTDGLTHSTVFAAGAQGSLEAFRQLCVD